MLTSRPLLGQCTTHWRGQSFQAQETVILAHDFLLRAPASACWQLLVQGTERSQAPSRNRAQNTPQPFLCFTDQRTAVCVNPKEHPSRVGECRGKEGIFIRAAATGLGLGLRAAEGLITLKGPGQSWDLWLLGLSG